MSGEDQGDLFGPDVSEQPEQVEIVGSDHIDVWAWQFCNRWVFLLHQRPLALKELRELIAAVTKRSERNGET